MEIVEHLEKGKEEIADKVGKKSDPIYLAGNPIGIAYKFVNCCIRDRENKRLEIWRDMSDVINGMPVRFLQELTIKKGGEEIITPQNSFLNYFCKKKFTEDKFGRNKFVEYFSTNEPMLWENLVTRKREGVDYVNELWKEFEHIVVKKKKVKRSKTKYGCANLMLGIKRVGRILLSGTGKYHIPAGNNSYLRINKI